VDIEYQDDEFFDPWDEEEPDVDLPGPPRWRRPAIVIVAVVTALALAVVPLYNLFGRTPPVSDSGLEVCRFDYCLVQERVTDAGLVVVMSRLSNTFLNDDEAVDLADEIARFLVVEPVRLTVVDRLEGRLGGVYDPAGRSILVQRPARAWIVAHEMAHVVSTGHGDEFMRALVEIARWLDTTYAAP
jgi:hypothetical protein